MSKRRNTAESTFWTLAIETSVMTSSVALLDGDIVQAERTVRTARGHASKLLPMVQDILEEAGLSPQDVNLIVVPVGPGSFTGIRMESQPRKASVGLWGFLWWGSVAWRPLLQELENGNARSFRCWMRGRRGILGVYRIGEDEGVETIMSQWLRPLRAHFAWPGGTGGSTAIFVGEGIRVYPEVFGSEQTLSRPWDVIRGVVMGQLGRQVFHRDGGASAEKLQPIYLRRSDAEIQVGLPTGTRKTVILG